MALIKLRISAHNCEKISEDWLATGSAGTDSVEITQLDSSWDGWTKSVAFKCDNTLYYSLISDGSAPIPQAVLNYRFVLVALYGTKTVGETEQRYTTNFIPIKPKEGPGSNGTTPPEPSPTLYGQIVEKLDELDAGKVDKVTGKGLSTNDYTTADKMKVSTMSQNIDAKVLVHNISNSSHSDIRNSIPTKTSDLTNDSGFIDNTVNDLVNYTKSSDIDTALSGKVDKVTGKGLSTNDFDNTYKTAVDNIGSSISAGVSTHNSAQNAHSALFADKVDKETGKGLSTNDYSNSDKSAVDGIGTAVGNAVSAHNTSSSAHSDIRLAKADMIIPTASANQAQLTDATDNVLAGLNMYGKSTQAGTPTPTEPISIVDYNAGITVFPTGGNIVPVGMALAGTRNGVTLTDNNDGTITLNGTCTANTVFISDSLVSKMMYVDTAAGKRFGYKVFSGSFTGTVSVNVQSMYNRQKVGGTSSTNINISGSDGYNTVSGNKFGCITRVYAGVTDGSVLTNLRIGLFFSDTATEYTAPNAQSMNLPYVLRGLKTTSADYTTYIDADNQRWYADEIDFERGKYIQRIGQIVYDGSENWSCWYSTPNSRYYVGNNPDAMIGPSTANMTLLSDKFTAGSTASDLTVSKSAVNGYLSFTNDAVLTGASAAENKELWKAWLASNNVTVQYPLAVPVEADLTAEELEAYRALHTYKYNTTISSSLFCDTAYRADTKKYIDRRITEAVLALS